jgi:chorismate synthase
MSEPDWKIFTRAELELAEESRANGNEGRARVCARRAAGHVAKEYLQQHGININTDSALERLRYLETYPELSSAEVEIVHHFLVHTTPEHNLPIEADLILDVHLLINVLLDEPLD